MTVDGEMLTRVRERERERENDGNGDKKTRPQWLKQAASRTGLRGNQL